MEHLEREEQAVDDVEVVIVLTDPDEVTDEEDVRVRTTSLKVKCKILSIWEKVDIFEEFFSDKDLEMVINQSEIYANQKNRPGFSISKEELKAFVGILLLSSYHKLPQEDMYWEHAPDVGDEMMVRYYGRHPAKMFMRGKPIKFGYKIWCLCSSNGYLYNFSPYCGRTDTQAGPFGLREISELTSIIPADKTQQIKLFFDNFFTSVDALTVLKARNIKATGTMRDNRTSKCPVMSTKDIEKKEQREFCDFRFDTTNEILILKCKDNKVVTVGTNVCTVEPFNYVRRYSQKK
ncbi:hypothetical protein ANN_28065 [Periplaneta americana]|uniref:PiggyBac transposable element-derived protein domain-containing protein n=1 Tax=Periplaneta americana TaxID=6978 RepID=A0ABQ8RUV2_PERAM|nr:hypothetical protein ANN_28065 [Periplaneta americana]